MAQPFRHPSSGMFYIRRRVPEPLRSILGREYKRSLGTKDPNEAKRAFAIAWGESEIAFATAKSQLKGTAKLGAKDIQQLAASWYHRELAEVEYSGRFTQLLYVAMDYIERGHAGHAEPIERVHSLRKSVDEGSLADWADELLPHINGTLRHYLLPQVDKNSPLFPQLLEAFVEHLCKLSDVALQRHHGVWTTTADVLPPALPHAAEAMRKKVQNSPLSEVFKQYSKDKLLTDGDSRSVRKTLDEYRGTIARFTELYGDLPVTDITRQRVQDFRQELAKMPSSGKDIRKLSTLQQIERAQAEGLPTLSAATIRKHMKSLSSVLGFGEQLGLIRENPVTASGVTKRLARATAKAPGAMRRKDYTLEELRAIFAGPVHAGGWCSGKDAAMFWLPLLLCYTGARREEIAQLSARDVAVGEKNGQAYLSILATPEEGADERTVKTQGSRRIVPIHPDLEKLGFLSYASTVPKTGQLFPSLKANPTGWYGHNFGKRWGRYVRDQLGLSSSASPSHGFRHSFKTLCRQAGIAEDVHDAITGHSDGSVSRSYGNMPLERMASELAKIHSVAISAGLIASESA